MIRLKTEKDLQFLRVSGKILAHVLKILTEEAKEGIVLTSLDYHARTLIQEAGAKPAFLGYKPEGAKNPYPAAICASVNEKIVHGIPNDYVLKNGDLLKIDLGVNYKGYFTDAAITVGIGRISAEAQKIIEVTKQALNQALEFCKPGNYLGDIGWIIEQTVKKAGFSIAKGLTGHGVGFELHEEPTIYNYGKRGEGLELKPGMVLAIEPMVTSGQGDIFRLADGSYAARDGSLTAHFEHTVVITHDGVEILTK